MRKTKLKIETRLRVLEMASEIAAEAADNTHVVWMIEFQEELVERLYRKMIALLEEGPRERDGGSDDEEGKSAEPKRSS